MITLLLLFIVALLLVYTEFFGTIFSAIRLVFILPLLFITYLFPHKSKKK